MPGSTLDQGPARGSLNVGSPRASIQLQDPTQSGRGAIAAPDAGYTPSTAIPAFLQEMVQPYIEQKQTETFWKGFNDQVAKGATDEAIDTPNKASQFFGPTSYEQGAGFYAGTQRVQNLTQDLLDKKDDLAQMDPSEVSKFIATKSKAMMTGNPAVDAVMQGQLVKQVMPVIATIQKTRVAQLNFAAANGMTQAATNAGSQYNQMAQAQLTMSSPDDESNVGMTTAKQTLLTSLGRPTGMSVENHAKVISKVMDNLVKNKNFFAVKALRESGVMAALPIEDSTKLEGEYQAAGKAALAEGLGAELHTFDKLAFLQKKALIPGSVYNKDDPDPLMRAPITPADTEAILKGINSRVQAATGVTDIDAISPKEIREATVGQINQEGEAAKTEATRMIEHTQARADKAADKAEEAAAKIAGAQAAWSKGTGAIDTLPGGPADPGAFALIARADVQAGNTAGLVRDFDGGHQPNEIVANLIKQPILSSQAVGYTNDLKNSITYFQKLNAARPGAAMAYYGTELYPKMAQLSSLIGPDVEHPARDPQISWEGIFGNGKTGGKPIELPFQLSRQVEKDVPKFVQAHKGTNYLAWLGIGQEGLNASAQRVVTNNLMRNASLLLAGNTSLDPKTAYPAAFAAAQANGSLEVHGAFAWENAPNTTPMNQELRLPPETFNSAFTNVVHTALKAKDAHGGADGQSITFSRVHPGEDDETVHVIQTMPDGKEISAVISPAQVKEQATKEANASATAAMQLRLNTDAVLHHVFVGDGNQPSFKDLMTDQLKRTPKEVQDARNAAQAEYNKRFVSGAVQVFKNYNAPTGMRH